MVIDIIALVVTASAIGVAARCYVLLCRRDSEVEQLSAEATHMKNELDRLYQRLREEPAYDRRKQQ